MSIILLIVWLAYAGIQGETHAWVFYWRLHAVEALLRKNRNLHPIFTFERGIVGLSIGFVYTFWLVINNGYCLQALVKSLVFFATLPLSFSCMHNGFYHLERHMIDGSYAEKFKADPAMSLAKTNVKYEWRLWLFIVALIIDVVLIFI